jgi:hypothetical protein
MIIISSTVNLSPLIKLQSVHAVCTLPLICGKLLSIRSNPLLSVTVPQYTQGCVINSNISSDVKSQSSIRWYAFRKYVARPRCVRPYRNILSLRNTFCSGVSALQRSFRRSRPFLRSLWHSLHSYDKPNGRDFSRWKFSGVASKERMQRKQVRCVITT